MNHTASTPGEEAGRGLSDERIREIGGEAFGIDIDFDGRLMRFARAIEREAALPLLPPDSLGVPASPSGSTLQPPAAASASIPNAETLAAKAKRLAYEMSAQDVSMALSERGPTRAARDAARATAAAFEYAIDRLSNAAPGPVPFKAETWPVDADGHEANLCTECGTPTRYGSRHSTCGRKVMEAERAALARGMEARSGETEGLDPKGDSPVGEADAPKQDGAPNNESSSKREAPASADMRAICEALGFDPTNHHNAAKCPYCRPPEAPASAGPDAVREALSDMLWSVSANPSCQAGVLDHCLCRSCYMTRARAALTSAAPTAAPALGSLGKEWLVMRPAIIDALAAEGLEIVSNKDRVWIHRRRTPPHAAAPAVEVRCNEDGSLDEVVGSGRFHLEQMSDTHWWMEFEDASGNDVHVNFHGQITASYEREQSHG